MQPSSSAPVEHIFGVASRLLSVKCTTTSTMDPEFAGKVFFLSENWEWFEDQMSLVHFELTEADGIEVSHHVRLCGKCTGCPAEVSRVLLVISSNTLENNENQPF